MASVARAQQGPSYPTGPEARPNNTTSNPADDLEDFLSFDYGVPSANPDIYADVDINLNGPSDPKAPLSTQQRANAEAASKAGVDREIQTTRKARTRAVKLDEARLLSQQGIPALKGRIKKMKFKGKGHEHEDARRLLSMYQLWLDDLFPKGKFADALSMVEKLGRTRQMQMYRKAWIEEGKPKPAAVADDDDFLEDALGNQQPAAVTNQVDASAAPNGPDDVPDDDDDALFMPDSGYHVEKPVAEDATAPDEMDELEALLAEDAQIRHHNGLEPLNLRPPADEPEEDDYRNFDDDMNLMRELDM